MSEREIEIIQEAADHARETLTQRWGYPVGPTAALCQIVSGEMGGYLSGWADKVFVAHGKIPLEGGRTCNHWFVVAQWGGRRFLADGTYLQFLEIKDWAGSSSVMVVELTDQSSLAKALENHRIPAIYRPLWLQVFPNCPTRAE
ncbi:MAG TPA: hypothetical protein VMW04_03660 [Patescibacteria group bacterium]|nr:hypothetical protein [Patescibacteria group bacterium]